MAKFVKHVDGKLKTDKDYKVPRSSLSADDTFCWAQIRASDNRYVGAVQGGASVPPARSGWLFARIPEELVHLLLQVPSGHAIHLTEDDKDWIVRLTELPSVET